MTACERCGGTGAVRRYEQCTTCAGQGYYQHEDDRHITLTRCADCGGDGHTDSFLNPEADHGTDFLSRLGLARAGFQLLSKGSEYQFMGDRTLGEINMTWGDIGPESRLSEDKQTMIREARREKGLGQGWIEREVPCPTCDGTGAHTR